MNGEKISKPDLRDEPLAIRREISLERGNRPAPARRVYARFESCFSFEHLTSSTSIHNFAFFGFSSQG
jgi:hypothetical protein